MSFFIKVSKEQKIDLPAAGEYGTGLIFLPTDKEERKLCKDIFAKIIVEEGQVILGWRELPVDNSSIGKSARETEPEIEQVFIGRAVRRQSSAVSEDLNFERSFT
jgi:glutamate synthase domain-containing protein 1